LSRSIHQVDGASVDDHCMTRHQLQRAATDTDTLLEVRRELDVLLRSRQAWSKHDVQHYGRLLDREEQLLGFRAPPPATNTTRSSKEHGPPIRDPGWRD
jgi:hypothetical protein